MRKRSSRLWDSCTRQLGLETKLEKRWFIAAFILLFVYLWICQFLRSALVHSIEPNIASSVLFAAIPVLPVCVFGVFLFRKLRIVSISSTPPAH